MRPRPAGLISRVLYPISCARVRKFLYPSTPDVYTGRRVKNIRRVLSIHWCESGQACPIYPGWQKFYSTLDSPSIPSVQWAWCRSTIRYRGEVHPESCHEGTEGAEVWIYAVITWTLNFSRWSKPRPGLSVPGKGSGSQCTGGWAGLRASLNKWGK